MFKGINGGFIILFYCINYNLNVDKKVPEIMKCFSLLQKSNWSFKSNNMFKKKYIITYYKNNGIVCDIEKTFGYKPFNNCQKLWRIDQWSIEKNCGKATY